MQLVIIGIDASRAALAHHTGTETYAYQLLLALVPLASVEVQLRLYTHQAPQPTDWPDTPFVETRLIPFPRLWTHLRLGAEISQHPPDVLFVPAHVLPLHCPVPAVVTVHDLGYLYYPEAHTPFQRWYLDWTTRRHTRVAQRLIADSIATQADLVEHYEVAADLIEIVHLGFNPTLKPTPQVSEIMARYGIDGPYLLYLGTLQPRKNLLRLLEAFHMVHQNHQIKLVLAGQKGWLYDQIFKRVQQLNLENQVIFPGFISEEDKAALLSGALAYVFPSLYEGFGLPVLEAMACGTPVLTSNTSSMPEIVGDAALLVNPHSVPAIAQGLEMLLADANLRQTLVMKGFQRVEKFSWSKAAQKILHILTQTAQTK